MAEIIRGTNLTQPSSGAQRQPSYEPPRPAFKFKLNTGLTIEEIRRETITLIYGLSGMGKSTISKTWGKHPLSLMMAGGGEHRPMHVQGTNNHWIPITSKETLESVTETLEKLDGERGYPEPTKPLIVDGQEIDSIIFDQIPSFYRMQTGQMLSTVARTRENKETPADRDYIQLRRRTHLIVNQLTKVRVHKLYLCIMEIDKEFRTGVPIRIAPALSDSLISDFMSFADFVFYLTMEDWQERPGVGKISQRRCVYTQPGSIPVGGQLLPYLAKDSSNRLPPKIWIPDVNFNLFEEVMKYLDPSEEQK